MSSGVYKSQGASMKCLTTAELKAILDICLIGSSTFSTQYLHTTIALIGKQRMPDMLHVSTNLVSTTIVDVLDGKGQIITVVGAGGNRDKGKRPLMAQESVKYSDKVIITSDNPRFEEY